MVRSSYIARTGLAGILLALGFTAAAGFSLLALLTGRLRRMVNVVREFQDGDMERRAVVQGRDELSRLAEAFNGMADTIVADMARLEQADRHRREILANISHDLRSPLASIRGYAETMTLREGRLSSEERKEYLGIIQRNGARLSRLVEDLLELARLDAQEIRPEKVPFQVAELVQDVVLQFKDRAQTLEIDLVSDVPTHLPMVEGDIALLERVLVNLIENALQFTPAGGRVTVVAGLSGEAVTIGVEDTGCGIPEEEAPRVFERFYRVEKSRSRSRGEGGTGLGLAIARRITELHGATLQLDSVPDRGSRFFFSLQT
jgi:signal transduction histidine kinase